MRYVDFDPEKHKDAFAEGKLFELQTVLPEGKGGPIISRWVKVTEQAVYEDALGTPWFFAVQMREASKQVDMPELGQPLPTAEALGGWRITEEDRERIEADFDATLALFEQQETEKSILEKLFGRKQVAALRTLAQQLKFVRFRQSLFEREAAQLAERLVKGQISLADWQLQRKEQIKMLHGTCAIAAKGGNKAAMTFHDWGIVGAKCKDQYKHINKFAQSVKEKAAQNKLTLEGVRHRSQQYANAGMSTFYQIRTEVAEEEGQTEVKWLVSAIENCSECLELRDMGWMSIAEFEGLGQMPHDGQRLCGPSCACDLEYR